MSKPTIRDRRHFLAGATALSAAAMLPWSGSLWAAAEATRGGRLRISVDQAVNVLNPLIARVNPEYLVAELLYSGLTRLSAGMDAEPDLAESWQANAALTEWTFRLREGVVFHDGSACTAEDAAASLRAILDPANAAPGRRNIGPIIAIEVPDPHTLVLRTDQPFADLPVTLTHPTAKVVPRTIAEQGLERLAREAIGCGPFVLERFEPERQVVVSRNPRYYDAERPYLEGVEVRVYPDPTAEGSALIAGDIDMMLSTQATEYERLAHAAGVKALRVPSGQFLNINMACDRAPFDDPRVRQALALCIDRAAMVDFVAEGYGAPGQDTPVSPAYRYYAEQPPKAVDIERARELLAEAGHGDGLDLTLVASDTPSTRTQLAIAVREMAAPAGFRITVETMANSTYLEQVWQKGSFYIGFYNMQPTVDALFSLLYVSDAAWNETRWNDAEFDRLVAQARSSADDAERTKLYAQAQQAMHDQVPSVIPVFFDLLSAQRSYVLGYALNPRGAVFQLDRVWFGAGAPQRG